MTQELLFTRKYNKKTYSFYLNKGVGALGLYSEYISVDIPVNDFDYPDTILFNSAGKPYTLNRYLQPWILKAVTDAIIKNGYSEYIGEWKNDHAALTINYNTWDFFNLLYRVGHI